MKNITFRQGGNGSAQLRVEYLPLSKLKPARRNPKKHNVPDLIESYDRFGFVSPMVIDERTGRWCQGMVG